MSTTKAVRRLDGPGMLGLEPGEYALEGTVDAGHLIACLPHDDRIRIPVGGDGWTAIENDDGSLTIEPSIRVTVPPDPEQDWHGWLRAGEWVKA